MLKNSKHPNVHIDQCNSFLKTQKIMLSKKDLKKDS